MNTTAIGPLPRVEAALRYLEPMQDKPRSLEYEPPPGVPRSTAIYRDHTVAIRDVRPVASARGPIQDAPLAVADAQSVESDDLVATDLVYPDRIGEIYYVKFNPSHRWFYAPAMRPDEVLLIKCFDSVIDGRARFVPHSAFVDPTSPSDATPRESIELRTLVFY